MKYKLAIFDLDGTLLYTLEDLKNSLNYALKKCNMPERTLDEVRKFVGNGIRKLIERGVPQNTSAKEIEKVYEIFTKHYDKHCLDTTRPYDGVEELVKQLRKDGIKTAVVSNKDDTPVQTLCERYFPNLFDFTVGQRDGIRKKPYPDTANEVLRVLKVDKSDAVYIGDSEVDIQTAANAGMDEIAVTWGFREKDFLEKSGGKVFADTPEEVYKLIV